MISDAPVHFTTSTLQFPGIEKASCRSGCGNGAFQLRLRFMPEDSLAPSPPLIHAGASIALWQASYGTRVRRVYGPLLTLWPRGAIPLSELRNG
jgi:hypothetical protein